MNKKGIAPVFLGIILFSLITMGVLSITGVFDLSGAVGSILGGYDSIYKQEFGHVCCLEGPLQTLGGPRYADDISSYSCDKYVDKCEITLTNMRTGSVVTLINAHWKICNLDESGCSAVTSHQISKGSTYSFDLAAGKKILFVSQLLSDDRDYYTWEAKGKLYSLISEENGKIFSGATGSCYLTSELKGKVLAESPNPIPKGDLYCQNYLIDFIQVATKTYSYNGQKVICQARELYEVETETLKDGNQIQLQGERIKSVECCPSEPNCNSNFEFQEENVRECSISSECANAGNPFPATQTTAKYFVCESGQCVQKIKSVECTSDAVCQTKHGEGYVCDLTPANWGSCIEGAGGTYCGDGYCDIGESKSSCPSDCEIECSEGEKLVTIEKQVNCKVLFWACETKIEKYCQKEGGFNWNLWIGLAVVLLILFAFRTKILILIKKLLHI